MDLIFTDTETTGTNPEIHEAWQVGLVVDRDGEIVHEESLSIRPERLNIADPKALEIGGFHEFSRWAASATAAHYWTHLAQAAEEIELVTRGAMLASCNISFDTSFLRKLQIRGGQAVTWHYSPLDVKSYALAALLGEVEPGARTDDIAEALLMEKRQGPHNALADAHLARAIYYFSRTRVLQPHQLQAAPIPEDLRV